MKIRCELHLGNETKRVLLVPKQEERLDHLSLKLASFTMFADHEPIVDPSSEHPALTGVDFRPDVMMVGEDGQVDHWIECGFVTLNKLDKITRRFHRAKILVLKGTLREAERLRKDLQKEVRHHARICIWAWPDGEFDKWVKAMAEKVEIFGEAGEKHFNLVINEHPVAVDLLEI